MSHSMSLSSLCYVLIFPHLSSCLSLSSFKLCYVSALPYNRLASLKLVFKFNSFRTLSLSAFPYDGLYFFEFNFFEAFAMCWHCLMMNLSHSDCRLYDFILPCALSKANGTIIGLCMFEKSLSSIWRA